MEMYCSFCGLGKSPEREFVAGPAVFICSDCIRLASNILAEQGLGGKRACSICGTVSSPDTFLIFEGQGYLCAECVRAVRAATDSAAST